DALAEDDLAGKGFVAEAGGEVADAADRAVVVSAVVPDSSEGGIAERDPDGEVQLVAASQPLGLQLGDGLSHLGCHPYCAGGRVGTRDRVVEPDHQSVAGEPADGRFVLDDD